MILHKSQKEIAKDTHRFRVLNCGRRFGKTVLAVEEMLGVAVAKGGRRVAYYAPTRDDARDITWEMLVDRAAPLITYKNESRLEIRIRTQDLKESTIILYGWEAVKEREKGRGVANDFIVCDEVSFYRGFWQGWNNVLSPTLIDRMGSALFISTPKGYNEFYELCEMEKKDKDYKYFHYTSYDNPFIPESEIDREKLSKPEDVFAQEYLAEFKRMKGLVYKEFSRDWHIFNPEKAKIRKAQKMAGIDFGFTNPTAILEIWKDHDNNYFVMDEYYEKGKTDDEIAEYASAKDFEVVYPDPENPAAIEVLRRKQVNCRDVVKGKDSITNGINKVRDLFRNKKLKISKNCVNLIWELENYRYPDYNPEKNQKELPIKDSDHALDALRYVIMSNAPKRPVIRNIPYGNKKATKSNPVL